MLYKSEEFPDFKEGDRVSASGSASSGSRAIPVVPVPVPKTPPKDFPPLPAPRTPPKASSSVSVSTVSVPIAPPKVSSVAFGAPAPKGTSTGEINHP